MCAACGDVISALVLPQPRGLDLGELRGEHGLRVACTCARSLLFRARRARKLAKRRAPARRYAAAVSDRRHRHAIAVDRATVARSTSNRTCSSVGDARSSRWRSLARSSAPRSSASPYLGDARSGDLREYRGQAARGRPRRTTTRQARRCADLGRDVVNRVPGTASSLVAAPARVSGQQPRRASAACVDRIGNAGLLGRSTVRIRHGLASR